jgi:acetyltransferase-like isoleucine patch superfamily enzyme
MARAKIDPTASVERVDLLGHNTVVRAGARLNGKVATEENVILDSNVIIIGPVTIARGTYVGSNCVIGHPNANEFSELQKNKAIKLKKETHIGRDCVIRSGSTIYSGVKIGDRVIFGHNVLIREDVNVGSGTKIGTNVVIDGKSTVGASVSIQTGVYICTYSTVEDGVFLGPCCVFTNDKYVVQKQFKLIGPTVRRGASIGANALLSAGITIGEGAVIGSQAFVNADVPPRTIYIGVPARKMKPVPDDWHSSLLQT